MFVGKDTKNDPIFPHLCAITSPFSRISYPSFDFPPLKRTGRSGGTRNITAYKKMIFDAVILGINKMIRIGARSYNAVQIFIHKEERRESFSLKGTAQAADRR